MRIVRYLILKVSIPNYMGVRLLEPNKRCEELMGKLEQQQIDSAKALSGARSPSITLPVTSTLITSNQPLKNG